MKISLDPATPQVWQPCRFCRLPRPQDIRPGVEVFPGPASPDCTACNGDGLLPQPGPEPEAALEYLRRYLLAYGASHQHSTGQSLFWASETRLPSRWIYDVEDTLEAVAALRRRLREGPRVEDVPF